MTEDALDNFDALALRDDLPILSSTRSSGQSPTAAAADD
jgi:hypothetical protein